MKYYDTPYGEVHLDFSEKDLIIRLSGGFDSALMLCLLALNAPKGTTIYPITVIRGNLHSKHYDLDKVDVTPYVNNIIKYTRNIASSRGITINDSLFEISENWRSDLNEYVETQNKLIKQIRDSKTSSMIQYNGVTTNPPVPIGLDEFREKNREPENIDFDGVASDIQHNLVAPFLKADKRITIWLADELNILGDLLDITRSCEGKRHNTKNFTDICKTECWWCLERQWALDNYKLITE